MHSRQFEKQKKKKQNKVPMLRWALWISTMHVIHYDLRVVFVILYAIDVDNDIAFHSFQFTIFIFFIRMFGACVESVPFQRMALPLIIWNR